LLHRTNPSSPSSNPLPPRNRLSTEAPTTVALKNPVLVRDCSHLDLGLVQTEVTICISGVPPRTLWHETHLEQCKGQCILGEQTSGFAGCIPPPLPEHLPPSRGAMRKHLTPSGGVFTVQYIVFTVQYIFSIYRLNNPLRRSVLCLEYLFVNACPNSAGSDLEIGKRRKWWNFSLGSRRTNLLDNDHLASPSGPPLRPEVAEARGRLARWFSMFFLLRTSLHLLPHHHPCFGLSPRY